MDILKDIDLVCFDFDGTLFDLQIDWDNLRKELDIAEGVKIGETIQQYMDQNDPKLSIVDRIEMEAVGDSRISDENAGVIEQLSNKGLRLAIFTRNSELAVEKSLEGTDISKRITIVGREAVRRLKPDPEGINILLAKFDLKPSSAILVGDTYQDVEVARNAGLKSVIVHNPLLQFEPKGADYYLQKLGDIDR
jgi:phosphoglycolate phosphatase